MKTFKQKLVEFLVKNLIRAALVGVIWLGLEFVHGPMKFFAFLGAMLAIRSGEFLVGKAQRGFLKNVPLSIIG